MCSHTQTHRIHLSSCKSPARPLQAAVHSAKPAEALQVTTKQALLTCSHLGSRTPPCLHL